MENWRKSSHSSGAGGQCVETASADCTVQVRDTNDREGYTLPVPAGAWRRFIATLR